MELKDLYVEVRDINLKRVGQIQNEFLDLSASPVLNGVGEWQITLPSEHHLVDELWTPGSGIVISHKGLDGVYRTLMSGPTTKPGRISSSADPDGTVTFNGISDEAILWDVICYPEPSKAITEQTLSHDVFEGHVETVMRHYVDVNIGAGAQLSRRGKFAQKLTQSPDLARGEVVKKSVRFDALGDLLIELSAIANLGFRVVQVGSGLEFQVYSLRDRTKFIRFDVENRTLSEAGVELIAPTATRAIVAGQGEGVERQLLQRTTTEATASEVEWGRVIEQFVDQRQTDVVEELEKAGDELVKANGVTIASVKAIPTEESITYGKDWLLGDKISTVVQGQELPSLITQIALRAHSGGVMIGAALGDVTGFDPQAALSSKVDDVESRISNLERNDIRSNFNVLNGNGASPDFWRTVHSGTYWNANNSVSGMPTAYGFIEVRKINNDMAITYYHQTGGVIYHAAMNASSVSIDWRVQNSSQGSLLTGTPNLNNNTITGVHFCDANSVAAAGANFPFPYAGMLEVFSRWNHETMSGGFVYQRYTTYKDRIHEMSERSRYNGIWGPWTRIVQEVGGEAQVTRLHITSDSDVPSPTAGSLTIGSRSGVHMQLDANEIVAQTGTAESQLNLQLNGGRVSVGGDLMVSGDHIGGANDATQFNIVRRVDSMGESVGYLRLRLDGTSELVESLTVYNRTYTNAANIYITSNGVIGRSTSLRANKANIESPPEEWADKVLELEPRWWFDKANAEKYKEMIDLVEAGEDVDWDNEDVEYPRRIVGFVAEEVAQIIPEMATYDHKGNLNGIAYDRAAAPLLMLVKKQQSRIDLLESQITILAQHVGVDLSDESEQSLNTSIDEL